MFDPRAHLIQLPRRVKDRATGQYTTVYDDYLEVKWRLVLFREQYPHGVITTEEICVDLDRGYARYKATVEDGAGGRATGYGTETQADFADFCERAETRALGRALAVLGFGTQFVGADLTEGEHVADAPVARAQAVHGNGDAGPLPAGEGERSAERLSSDQARALKALAQQAFGYAAGEARLRQDLGLEEGKALTLMRIAAHTTAAQYATLCEAYEAHLRQAVEADVP
jgi:hypothetical protein